MVFVIYFLNTIQFLLFLGLLGISIFVILETQFVTIRQNAFLVQLIQLNKKIKYANLTQLNYFCLKYFNINRLINNLCIDIKKRSQFWTSSLTMLFIGYITIQCYLAYIVFIVANMPLIERLFILYAILSIELMQFSLIHQCAKINNANYQLEKINKKINFYFFNRGVFTYSWLKHNILKVIS